MMIPPLPWDRPAARPAEGGGGKVVLLHGLWRSWHAMDPLARELGRAGYATLNLPYPSARRSIGWIADYVGERTESFAEGQPVHFVTHSLGGIILRALLAKGQPRWRPGRIVMMAPPSAGSEIIDWLSARGAPLVRLLGPAARELASDSIPPSLPPLPAELEAMVIMGNLSLIPFFRRLLDGENDGIVSAEKGRVEGLRAFATVPADHTFIQIHPDAVRHTLAFLRTGRAAAPPVTGAPAGASSDIPHPAVS